MGRRRVLYSVVVILLILAVFSIWFYMTQIMPESSRELTDLLTRQAIEYGN